MIKVNKEKVNLKGTYEVVLSELATIINTLNEKTEIKKEEIMYAIELGFMTEKELKKEKLKHKRNEKAMKEALKELLGGIINDI